MAIWVKFVPSIDQSIKETGLIRRVVDPVERDGSGVAAAVVRFVGAAGGVVAASEPSV